MLLRSVDRQEKWRRRRTQDRFAFAQGNLGYRRIAMTANAAVLWDQTSEPAIIEDQILGWQSYSEHDFLLSVPRYVEHHAERLRKKYLAFIHDLGEYHIAGKRVVDHMNMGDGFSLWWMTTLAEKSPLK